MEARRGNRDNDRFYIDDVVRALQTCSLDRWLAPLRQLPSIQCSGVRQIIVVHEKLCQVFRRLTGLKKRALASKYLHFHVPQLFYLYDSRARRALRGNRASEALQQTPVAGDTEYRSFVLMACTLQHEIMVRYGITPTPRQLDRLLLRASAIQETIEWT
jgi:hypothetical protein